MNPARNTLELFFPRLRWRWYITLPLAFLIFHLGTRASIYFSVAPGTALWYWPIPLGVALIQWWGPSILLPLYLNAVFSAGLWGLPQWQFWPLYGLPETGQVFLSWLLFTRYQHGQPWLPDLKQLQRFLLWGVFLPSFVCNLWLQGQFLLLGDLAIETIGAAFLTTWMADMLGSLVVTVPALHFLTTFMEKTGLSLTNRGQAPASRTASVSQAWKNTILLLVAIWVISVSLPLQEYWFVYGFIVVGMAFQPGLKPVLIINAWIVFCVLVLPTFFPTVYQQQEWIAQNVSNAYLSLGCLFIAGISVARSLEDLRTHAATLAESEARFRLLAENSTDIISRHNPEGVYLYVSPACERLIGYSPDELVGHSSHDFIYPDDIAKVEQARSTILKQEVISTTVYRVKRKDGTLTWLETTCRAIFDTKNQKAIEIHAATRDVNERKKAEAALRKERDRAQNYLDMVETIILALDLEGKITLINRKGCRLLGYQENELLGQNWFNTCLPQPKLVYPFFLELTSENRESMEYFENAVITRSGELRQIAWHNSVLRDDDTGRIAGILSAGEDITERKRSDEKIKKALVEKETLLRELYHRTKNNMGVIIGLLDLQSDYFRDERLQMAFREAQDRIHSMALVHQKLYDTQDLSHINLKEYITNLVVFLMDNYSIRPGKVSLVSEMEDVSVLIDTAIPCGLIMNELITNALKYAFPGDKEGNITIRLHRAQDGFIHLGITDDGIGIPPGFDFRKDGRMGMKTILILAENQLRARLNFHTEPGVTCHLQFNDNLYDVRI